MTETAKRRLKNPNFTPEIGLATQFSSEHQPKPENIGKGMKKAGLLRRLMDIQLSGKGEKLDKIREQLSALTGLPENQVSKLTLEAVSHLRQIEKSILSGDTYAYNSYQNREYGPKAETMNLDIRQAIVIQVISPEQAEQVTRLEDVR